MVTRLRAPNPSPMTLDGTNGYVIDVGPGALVAIDPGIDNHDHIQTFVDAARDKNARYAAILVTHGHPDHYPGALALRRETGAPIFAHPAAKFVHDRDLEDNAHLTFEDTTITVVHAPGHAIDHLVFWLESERALFTGDVIIGTGTVVIAPPSGDMRAYQATLERLWRDYGHAETIYGGHGPTIRKPRAKIEEYIEHRRERERQILAVLEDGPATIPELVGDIYADVNEDLWPAAGRQVLAYLIALQREGRIGAERLSRPPTLEEAHLLNPDLSGLARTMDLSVVRAELGFHDKPEPVYRFSLIS
jgi:glyoxylase-like metal-dependent hydrolase (beta-lactamase superfamily II)